MPLLTLDTRRMASINLVCQNHHGFPPRGVISSFRTGAATISHLFFTVTEVWMKRFVFLLGVCLVALLVNLLATQTASARPEYKKRLDEFCKNSKAADVLKEQSCKVCHFGTSKKNRNDFGKAVNKVMNEETFKSLKEDKEKLAKKVDEALKAAMKEKSSNGKTFGQLIEAGELPAKNPEE
jgi:hypothetical protein